MSQKELSRREFIRRNTLASVGTAIGLAGSSSLLATISPGKQISINDDKEPIIDIHQHTHYSGRNDDLLLIHQKAMGITRTILLPSGRPMSTASTHFGVSNGLEAEAGGNEACYNFARAHKEAFTFGACEVPDFTGATAEIEKYLKLGAKVIGELKFGVDCDAPFMQKIYKLAEAYDVPVLMHWQFEKYNYGFERFHKMLAKFPKVKFLGHAQTWWANVDKNHLDQKVLYPTGKVVNGGITDKLLSDYPNMFADLSAGSGLNFFMRDEGHTRDFLKRHQDKLIFGSDCSDHVGEGANCQGGKTIAAIRKLSADKSIERKLLYHNAKRIFGF